MRVALHTRVRAGREAEYDQAHQHVPLELVEAIRAAGVTEWTIWRSGRELFHLIECVDYAAVLERLQGQEVNLEWQARMAELLEVVHDYSDSGSAAGLMPVWQL